MALADAVRWGLLARNPVDAAQADLPKSKGSRRSATVWTAEQLRSFLIHVAQDRLYSVWLLAVMTGMRRAELCGLEWGDVDLDAGRLTVRRDTVMMAGRALTHTPKSYALLGVAHGPVNHQDQGAPDRKGGGPKTDPVRRDHSGTPPEIRIPHICGTDA